MGIRNQPPTIGVSRTKWLKESNVRSCGTWMIWKSHTLLSQLIARSSKWSTKSSKKSPLTINRGKIHDKYLGILGMTLDFTKEGKVNIKMFDYVEKRLADLPKEMDGKSPTPACSQLPIWCWSRPTIGGWRKGSTVSCLCGKDAILMQACKAWPTDSCCLYNYQSERTQWGHYKQPIRMM